MIARLVVAMVCFDVLIALIVLGSGDGWIDVQVPWRPIVTLTAFGLLLGGLRLRRGRA